MKTVEEMVEFVYGRDGEADVDEIMSRQGCLTVEEWDLWDSVTMEEVNVILDRWLEEDNNV